MDQFTTDKIRNVVLLAHSGAGKTSLAEAMLFATKAIGRLGKVEDGTTVTDYDRKSTTGIRAFSWRSLRWSGTVPR